LKERIRQLEKDASTRIAELEILKHAVSIAAQHGGRSQPPQASGDAESDFLNIQSVNTTPRDTTAAGVDSNSLGAGNATDSAPQTLILGMSSTQFC
jgi:hypothetical protein